MKVAASTFSPARSATSPVFLNGCEGCNRGISQFIASDVTGADWLVIQYDMNGTPFRCWQLERVGVTSESGSDGIFWKSREGNLVHVSGIYNYIQVDDWDSAYGEAGITESQCKTLNMTNLLGETL